MGQSLQAGREAYEEVLGRPGRYRKVAKNLRVKEVVVGEGARRRRYALCWNAEEAKRQKQHRDRVLEELAAELELLQESRRKAQEQAKKQVKKQAKAGQAPAQGDGKTAAGAQSEGRAGGEGTGSAGPGC